MIDFSDLKAEVKTSEPSELHPELLGISAINPLVPYTSASRLQMVTSHLTQGVPIHTPEARLLCSGLEGEFGKYTYRVQMPCDGEIIMVREKYPQKYGQTFYGENPEVFALIQCDPSDPDNTMQYDYDCIIANKHHFMHEEIGFQYKNTKNIQRLQAGNRIKRGTDFMVPNSIAEDGWYNYGVNANMVMITDPAGAEDGIKVRKGFLDKLKYTTYERVVFQYGKSTVALNIHGDENHYKPLLDVGSVVPADGIVGASRPSNTEYRSIDLTSKNLMTPNEGFDNIVRARPGGVVVDMNVIINPKANRTAEDVAQAHLYDVLSLQYCASINDYFEENVRKPFLKKYNREPKLSNQLHNFLSNIKILVASRSASLKVGLSIRKTPLDQVYVSYLIKHENTPNMGSKLTDINGGKGVIVSVVDDDKMPVDANGVVADVVTEPSIGRMNVGRLYEPYFNAAGAKVHAMVCEVLGCIPFTECDLSKNLNIEHAFNMINYFYSFINPNLDMRGRLSTQEIVLNMQYIVRYGVYLVIPTNNVYKMKDIQKAINESIFKPDIETITVTTPSGEKKQTVQPVLIGKSYMILLQQTGNNWSATSSARLQMHGLIAPKSRSNKSCHIYNDVGNRFFGGSEGRILLSYTPEPYTAVNHDLNNNPALHDHVCNMIMSADNPMAIKNIRAGFDTTVSGNVPVNMFHHYLATCGLKLSISNKGVEHNKGFIETDEKTGDFDD